MKNESCLIPLNGSQTQISRAAPSIESRVSSAHDKLTTYNIVCVFLVNRQSAQGKERENNDNDGNDEKKTSSSAQGLYAFSSPKEKTFNNF